MDGATEPGPGAGWLDRPMDIEALPVPVEVRIDGQYLLWRGEDRRVAAEADLWRRFLRLADGSDADIRAFAADWGVLELCAHGVPRAHAGGAPDIVSGRTVPLCELVGGPEWYREDLAIWRRFAVQAKVISYVTDHLDWPFKGTGREEGFKERWSKRHGGIATADIPTHRLPKGTDTRRRWLAASLSAWLALGGVRPAVRWTPRGPDLRLTARTLAGAIAVQLLRRVGDPAPSVVCSGCGMLFCHDPLPRTGTNRFCDACQAARVSQNQAAMRYRRSAKGRAAYRQRLERGKDATMPNDD